MWHWMGRDDGGISQLPDPNIYIRALDPSEIPNFLEAYAMYEMYEMYETYEIRTRGFRTRYGIHSAAYQFTHLNIPDPQMYPIK